MREIDDLFRRIAALEKRLANSMRHGTVEEVFPGEGMVRLSFGDGDNGPFLSPKIPYAQVAGGLKVHTPPTQGQQMTYIAPAGDTRQAIALPMTWSDSNQSPSDKGDEHVLTFGDVRIEIKPGSVAVTVGGNGFILDADEMRMTTRLRAKGGSRAAHYVGGADTDGDLAVDGNNQLLI